MWDSDIFGVKDPESGMIGYCCVLGRIGEFFGLGVYKGEDGLEGYMKIQWGVVDRNSKNLMHVQNCLLLSFEDRKDLEKEDLEIIKKIGLKFRGHNEWPQFRDYTPGLHPWFLNSGEVRYLTLAIEQTIDVAMRFRDDPKGFKLREFNSFLTRVPTKDGSNLKWKDDWIEPEPVEPDIIPENEIVKMIDIKRIEKIRKGKRKGKGTWEIGSFFIPKAVKEGPGRPYYPKVIMFFDVDSEIILTFSMAKPNLYRTDFFDKLFHLLEQTEYLPKEIWVMDEEIRQMLSPVAEALKLSVHEAEELSGIEGAYDSMYEFFRSIDY
jgi:hypothetical protein